MAIPLQEFVTGFPVALSPAAIERELSSMWKRRAPEGPDDQPGSGVTRITLGNVIWLGTSRHAPRIRDTFARLVTDYPCRLFLLEYIADNAGADIEAFVNAYCFRAKGVSREVCCEEIHLRFGPEGMNHLRGAVLPLVVPDVPACLWYFTSAPEQYNRVLPQLAKLVDRVITESAFLKRPAEGLRAMVRSPRLSQDLAWFRCGPLRDHMTSIFDDPEVALMAKKARAVRVGWAGAADDRTGLVTGSLLAGWLASRLGWRTKPGALKLAGPLGDIAVEFFQRPARSAAEESEIIEFGIECWTGDAILLRMGESTCQMERIVKRAAHPEGGSPRYVHAGCHSDAEALGRALNARIDSQLFRDAATIAADLLDAAMGADEP